MKKVTCSTIFLIMVMFSSCIEPHQWVKNEDPAKQLLIEHGVNQEKKNKLELVALGVPSGEKIESFSMHLMTIRRLGIAEMRELMVENAQEVLETINNDETIRERLPEYPVTVRYLKLNIGSCDHDGEFYDPPDLGYAYLDEDKIYYCYYDNLFGKFSGYDDFDESFNKAKKIVKEMKDKRAQE